MKPLILAFALATISTSTLAQTFCAPRTNIIEKLKEKYGEAQRGMGLGGKEAVIEIWSSTLTGSWTIVMTRANGVTCILAAGDSWMDAPPEPGPET